MRFTLSPLPLRDGTLALCAVPTGADARTALTAFAPALVISMTEPDELQSLGAGDLPDWLAAQGILWRGFPIPDFGTPPPRADWAALARDAASILDTQGRVLLHCRGGLGRSGMVALRLMIEAGENADTALTCLRAARPGAVETKAQEHWATTGQS